MKKILVPCDFSKPSVHAFRFALDMAAQSKGTVHVLNVIELPVLHDSMVMPVLNFEEELLKELKEKAEASFVKLAGKYPSEGVKVVSSVVFGHVYGKILEYISEHAIELVVMGSHGVSGVRELLIGSNAEKVVRKAPVPVLVIKDYFKGPIKHIVFPNNLDTGHQEDLVMKVKALQHFFKAQLHVVWINTPVNFTSDYHTFKRLEAFAKRYMLKNYTLHVYNHADEEEGIIRFCSHIHGDLIALGTHGRKGFAHLINGSLAEDLANHTSGLVWTYSLKNEPVEA